MPEMDGLEATNIIRNELSIDIPVIGLTGSDESETKDYLNKGFNEILYKPIVAEKLHNTVNRWI